MSSAEINFGENHFEELRKSLARLTSASLQVEYLLKPVIQASHEALAEVNTELASGDLALKTAWPFYASDPANRLNQNELRYTPANRISDGEGGFIKEPAPLLVSNICLHAIGEAYDAGIAAKQHLLEDERAQVSAPFVSDIERWTAAMRSRGQTIATAVDASKNTSEIQVRTYAYSPEVQVYFAQCTGEESGETTTTQAADPQIGRYVRLGSHCILKAHESMSDYVSVITAGN